MSKAQTEVVPTFRDLTVIDALNFSRFDRNRLVQLRDAGVTCTQVTCAVWEDAPAAMRNIRQWDHLLEDNTDVALQVEGGDDIARAKAEGKVGIILGFQNTSPLNGDLEMVGVFQKLGIRIMQLTYNNQNLVAGGCYEPRDSGISRFGKEVIREMNRLGVLVDLSHVGDESSAQAIEWSERPVAVTHSNPKWFNDVSRNKSDRVIRLLSERDGVIGVSTFSMLLPGGTPGFMTSACTARQFAEMIARLVDQVGITHVGIGLDQGHGQSLDYILWCRMGTWTRTAPETRYGEKPSWTIAGSGETLQSIYQAIVDVGFAPQEIRAIMGENWHRLFAESFRPV